MIILLYIIGYLFLGTIITGVISGLDSTAFQGKDGGGFACAIVALWPLAGVAVLLFIAHCTAEYGVKAVKKFVKV